MKKLLLISALALCAGGAMAQTPLILAEQGDSGSESSWSWGVTVSYPSSLSMVATAGWGKLNIASGISEINTIVVDVAEITGEWKLCDDQTKQYSNLLTVGKNTIKFSSTAKGAKLMAEGENCIGYSITLNSVTIDGVQTTYAKDYGIAFYNLDITVTKEWGSRYLGGANSLGDKDAVITIELNSAVEEGDFQLVVKRNDEKGTENYYPFSGSGGSIEVGNNILEARIMGCTSAVGKTISVKSVTISHATALRPISSDTEVVNTTYYNLAGVKATTPQKGLNIVVRTLSDGSKVTEKLLVK